MRVADGLLGAVGAGTASEPDLDLVALLDLRAEREGLSGAEMARRAGIDQSLWSRVARRRDGVRLGVAVCVRVVARYPELKEAAVRYLADGTEVDRFDPEAIGLLEEAAVLRRSRTPDCAS